MSEVFIGKKDGLFIVKLEFLFFNVHMRDNISFHVRTRENLFIFCFRGKSIAHVSRKQRLTKLINFLSLRKRKRNFLAVKRSLLPTRYVGIMTYDELSNYSPNEHVHTSLGISRFRVLKSIGNPFCYFVVVRAPRITGKTPASPFSSPT